MCIRDSCITYANYICADLPARTENIASAINAQINKDSDIRSNNFIYYLTSLKSDIIHEIFISDKSGNLIATTSTNEEEKNEYSKRPNLIYALIPETALITNNYYVDTYNDEARQLKYYIYYDISDRHDSYAGMVRLLSFAFIVGFVIFIFAGFSHTNNVLKPIDDITAVAKKINGENLSLRISEQSTKSELNELAGTINDMMDRIQACLLYTSRCV